MRGALSLRLPGLQAGRNFGFTRRNLATLSDLTRPRVLKEDDGGELAAIGRRYADSRAWTPECLETVLPQNIPVKQSRQSSFMYYEAGNPRMMEDSAAAPTIVDMAPRDMFTLMSKQAAARGVGLDQFEAPVYAYFTSDVASVAPQVQRSDAPDWTSLRPEEVNGFSPAMHIWIGGSGSTTQAHYDVAHNIFIQTHGRKRFLLWPTSELHHLHVYPDAHPLARKSQVNFSNPQVENFPYFANLGRPQEVILEPGDVLFIPAFYFHHVEALELSVSVNVFSEAGVRLLAGRALSRQMPFDQSAAADRHLAAAIFSRLLHAITGPETEAEPVDFVRELYTARYAPLVAATVPIDGLKADHGAVDAATERAVAMYARDIRHDLARTRALTTHDEAYCTGVSSMVLGHLLEMWAVGLFGPANVRGALKHCVDNGTDL